MYGTKILSTITNVVNVSNSISNKIKPKPGQSLLSLRIITIIIINIKKHS